MIEYLRTLILGLVEGITEWLPISSTGHMILVNKFIHNEGFTASDLYLYVIQLGAILAVVTLYFRTLNPFSKKKSATEKKSTWQLLFKIVIGCIPAAVVGLLLNDMMEKLETPFVVAAALIVYGIAFILVEKIHKKVKIKSLDQLTYKTAFLIGLFQMLSIVPGTSRSGSTIIGGMLAGCSRAVAAEFTFFLAVPVMFGVSALKIVTYHGIFYPANIAVLITGMVISYIVSLIAIKFLMNFVKRHSFTSFGWYRIILGVFVTLFFVFTGI
ncbi:MAG: undecaprenyl-diphosphate phosphatase [Oscillospiraceae bacterium]|nr:undecaprenyl-diphosphate phosphatase [Oscillospiraceae bacterium]